MNEPWQQAMHYLGVPFRHRGRTVNGLDCAGLLVRVALDLGHTVKDLRVYGREPQNDGLADFLRANCGDPVQRPPQVNDILLLRHRPGLEPNHLALVAPHPDGLGIVHAYGEVGRVVFQGLSARRKNNIAGVYRWPEKQ